jgi:hypothetical protein
MLSDRPWTLAEKLEAIDCELHEVTRSSSSYQLIPAAVCVEDVQQHMSELLRQTHIKALVVGNIEKQV